MRRLRIRPSKPASALGMVVGIVFIGIGLFFAIPVFGAFGIFWTLVAVAITGFHAMNVFSDRGIAMTEIEVVGETSQPKADDEMPFDERLRRLVQLRVDELITEEEYRRKRDELMAKEW
jgi:hypothetical protein